MDDDAVFALVATERRRAADMFEGLTDRQWATPSMCTAWTVRGMAGHLTLPFQVAMPRMVLGILRDRATSRGRRRARQRWLR